MVETFWGFIEKERERDDQRIEGAWWTIQMSKRFFFFSFSFFPPLKINTLKEKKPLKLPFSLPLWLLSSLFFPSLFTFYILQLGFFIQEENRETKSPTDSITLGCRMADYIDTTLLLYIALRCLNKRNTPRCFYAIYIYTEWTR